MPTNRSRRKRGRLEGFHEGRWLHLLTGTDFFSEYGSPPNIAQMLDDYQKYRDELLDYWTQDNAKWEGEVSNLWTPEPGGPGTRPWAWWQFEAPKSRRQISGRGEPLEGSPTSFGKPTSWKRIDPSDPPEYESERAYLERLGLSMKNEVS